VRAANGSRSIDDDTAHQESSRKLSGMPLEELPKIDRLTLGVVESLPREHPEHDTFEAFPVHAWLIHHPKGPILFDSGIGADNAWINEHYHPKFTSVVDALNEIGLVPDDVRAIVVSHLHFDHCGQLNSFSAPVFMQRVEYELAKEDGYTVFEWADIEESRLRLIDGDATIAPGVRTLSTPGHTPGHQSLVIETRESRVVLAGQCVFRADELRNARPSASNLHDESWADAASSSLARIQELSPAFVHFSHDTDIVAI